MKNTREKIKIAVKLRDIRDGFERIYKYEIEPEYVEIQNYLWTEGNYACDCNRSLFLYNHDGSKALDCDTEVIDLVWLKINGVIDRLEESDEKL